MKKEGWMTKHKGITLKTGELKEFPINQQHAVRYRARENGWKIETRIINNKFLVFRKK